MNFPITVATRDGRLIGTFYVGYVKSAVRGNTSLFYSCDTYRPENSGLKTILNTITGSNGWGAWHYCYVGTEVDESNKLGFRICAYKDTSTQKIDVELQDSETGTFFYFFFPGSNDADKDMYLCLPYIGEEDAFENTNITSKLKLRFLLNFKFSPLYTSKNSNLWRYGMGRFDTAPLVAVMHDGTRAAQWPNDTERPMYDLDGTTDDPRGYYHNLATFANWYHFLMGEFKYPVQYVETIGGKKIYLSKSLSQVNNDHLFKDGLASNVAYYQYTDIDNRPTYSYDYQSGTDLRGICGTVGDELFLTNGTTIRCRREVDSRNRYYYFYDVTHGATEPEGDLIRISTAFNARRAIGDLVNSNFNGDFNGGELYQMATTNNDMILQHVGLWVSPLVEGGVEAYIDDNSNFESEGFWNTWPMAPITICGVYLSNWNTPSSKFNSWSERADSWGKGSTVTPLMVSNISGYKDPNQVNYGDLVNLFSTINLPDSSPITISAFKSPYAGKFNVRSRENTKILWGIDDVIDPDIPDSGSGSIGGGSGGSHSGGSGSYDDEGDDVSYGTADGVGYTSSITNWYFGELGSTEAQENLDYLGAWLSTTGDPDSEHPFQGLGYKYSDKLNNICSLKIIYSPELPFLNSVESPVKIHGQNLHGTDTQSYATARKITNQFRQTTIGTFNIPEYFGSFLDYDPYTKVQIYLPFAGVQTLKASDIIGKEVALRASVDYVSGDIVYNLRVNTGTCNSVLYTFSGNTAVELPLTATDYSGKVMSTVQTILGAAGIVAGIAGAGFTGGASLMASGLIAGGASQVINGGIGMAMNDGITATKGAVGGTVGAMSPKQCYLIITRPKMVKADNYGEINGYPCMQSYRLNEVEGYIKIAECNWAIPGATEEEIDELAQLMKSEGAII